MQLSVWAVVWNAVWPVLWCGLAAGISWAGRRESPRRETLAPRPVRECFVKDFVLIMLLKSNPTGLGGRSSVSPRRSGTSPAQRRSLCQDGLLPVATPGKNPGWKGLCWWLVLGKSCSKAFGLGCVRLQSEVI